MSFEIKYKFHAKKDGKYDIENELEMTKKLGGLFEDISYEKLAATIMEQQARRDIMVVDVEVFEYVKKQITFKDSPHGGVIIKGKKYSYGDTAGQMNVQSFEQPPSQQQISQVPTLQNQPIAVVQPPPPVNTRPMRFEVFEPHPDFVRGAKKYAFTTGRDYPIYEEKRDTRGDMFGMAYTTVDDKGQRVIVPDKFFQPKVNLTGFGSSNSVDLYGGSMEAGMINIRGR